MYLLYTWICCGNQLNINEYFLIWNSLLLLCSLDPSVWGARPVCQGLQVCGLRKAWDSRGLSHDRRRNGERGDGTADPRTAWAAAAVWGRAGWRDELCHLLLRGHDEKGTKIKTQSERAPAHTLKLRERRGTPECSLSTGYNAPPPRQVNLLVEAVGVSANTDSWVKLALTKVSHVSYHLLYPQLSTA